MATYFHDLIAALHPSIYFVEVKIDWVDVRKTNNFMND
jgi:hypothetical protein